MQTKLTDIVIQGINPAGHRLEIADIGCPGLVLRVTKDGRKSWCVRYTLKGRRQARDTIGRYPGLSLKKARARASAIMEMVDRGEDPRLAARLAEGADLIFGDAAEDYLKDHVLAKLRRGKVREALFRRWILPKLGRIPLRHLRRADIVDLREHIKKAGYPVQANRAVSAVRAFINWALERQYLDASPAANLKKPRGSEKPRQRVFDDRELRALWSATEKLSPDPRRYMRFLLASGQRRDEVRLMRWSEIDPDGGVWVIPGDRYKTGDAQEVLLSTLMKEILAEAEKDRFDEACPYVFAGRDLYSAYNGTRSLKAQIDRHCKIPHWTLHDLRRTVRSNLARLGIPFEVAERVIGHRPRGIEAVYNVHSYRKQKAEALEAWSTAIEKILKGEEPTNVVLMPARAAEATAWSEQKQRAAG